MLNSNKWLFKTFHYNYFLKIEINFFITKYLDHIQKLLR